MTVDDGPRSATGAAGLDREAALASARARGESLDGLLDRNLGELLQELRVAITGVQILFAFLLGLAFTARFARLGGYQVTVYTVALLSTALATIVLIAPVSFHRMVFRRRQKAALVVVADRLLRVGLGLLVLAITSAVLLILDVVLGHWQGLVGGGLVALAGVLTWYALPVWARRSGAGAAPGQAARGDDPPGRPGSGDDQVQAVAHDEARGHQAERGDGRARAVMGSGGPATVGTAGELPRAGGQGDEREGHEQDDGHRHGGRDHSDGGQ